MRDHAQQAGNAGERRVARILAKAGLPAVHDLTITLAGRTHQLDHVVAGRDRLFVLETKTWRGRIAGAAGAERWTVQRPGQRPVRAYNPLLQNATHAQALAELAGVRVTPLVVSAGHAQAPDELTQHMVAVSKLAVRLGPPGQTGPAIAAAFERLATLKGDPRQARIAAKHRNRTSARFNPRLSHACWLVAAFALAITLAAAWQAAQG